MSKPVPRGWQREAIAAWEHHDYQGIASVVTGGGKTIFALFCVERLKPISTLIVVPTSALLEQWWEEAACFFRLELDEINIIRGKGHVKLGTINIAVLNTAAKLPENEPGEGCFLIVDECHKAASPKFRSILAVRTCATLGLSATPERPYDDGLIETLVPALGPVIYRYDYSDALKDRVIVPFELRNIVFELESDTQQKYDKFTRAIAQSIRLNGTDSDETISLFLRRARVLNLSMNRIRLALRIISVNQEKRTLVFHEDIEACELIHRALIENGIRSGVYHSRMRMKSRASMLRRFRGGEIQVLVTCRALDEGFNVPETELGIIAASTATRRQRIQRMGRIVRPSQGKDCAVIYTLVATGPEIERLKSEEGELEGVATVTWSQA